MHDVGVAPMRGKLVCVVEAVKDELQAPGAPKKMHYAADWNEGRKSIFERFNMQPEAQTLCTGTGLLPNSSGLSEVEDHAAYAEQHTSAESTL